MELFGSAGLFALVVFFLLVFLNIPISIGLGAAGVLVFIYHQLAPLTTLPMIFSGAIDSFTLLAIPLFILAGNIIAQSGIAGRLVHLAQFLFGRLPGGLAITVIAAGAFLGALSGSNVAAVAALGFMIGAMHNAGYPLPFSCATVAAGCTFGVVIPPSINLILYGVISGTSIPALFAAGIGPGLLLAIALSLYIVIEARRKRFPIAEIDRSWKNFVRSLKDASWGLAAPIIILGGIYGGVFTATEAAAVAVVYVFLVDRCVYRGIPWRNYPTLILNSGLTTGVVMLILVMASVLSYVLMMDGTALQVRDWMVAASNESSQLALLYINIILLVSGAFLDPVSAIYVLVPLVLPTVRELGIDPVHFGAIMTTNLSMAHITPPIGIALYVASQIAAIPFTKAAKAIIPFLICEIFVLGLVTFIPAISMTLVNVLA